MVSEQNAKQANPLTEDQQTTSGAASAGRAKRRRRMPHLNIGGHWRFSRHRGTEDEDDTEMPITDHLGELRKRIVRCAACFLIVMSLALTRAEWFVNLIIEDATDQGYTFVFLTPTELFMSYIRIALIVGIVVTIPVIVYNLWSFLRPGLTLKERRVCGVMFTFGIVMFLIGAVFAYLVALPIMLVFFIGLNTTQTITAMISIKEFINYVMSVLVAFGAVFELPIVVILLTFIGVVNPNKLQKNFKFIILGALILGAIITPPDITSQVLVATPIVLLCEGSIFISKWVFKKKIAKQEAEDAQERAEEAAAAAAEGRPVKKKFSLFD